MDSSVSGDPQFIGLDGRLFYFDGRPNEVFNLVSHQDHQLNALFVKGPHKIDALGAATQGTYLGAFGLKAYGMVLTLAVDEDGYMMVHLNGDSIGREQLAATAFARKVDLENEVSVFIEQYREGLGQAVTVLTPLFEFLFFPTMRGWDAEANQAARGHLNVAMSAELEELSGAAIHGVLGQTTPDRAPTSTLLPPELQSVFLGEGVPDDYLVSGLLADDFKFNLFQDLHAAKPKRHLDLTATSRRRRLQSDGYLSYLTNLFGGLTI